MNVSEKESIRKEIINSIKLAIAVLKTELRYTENSVDYPEPDSADSLKSSIRIIASAISKINKTR